MGKNIISLSVGESDIEGVLESCIILDYSKEIAYVDEFEVPYNFEVFLSTRNNCSIPDVIEIKGLQQLQEAIDEDDCLPDVGLLDYSNDKLGIDLKDVTLKELYRQILNKVL